MKKIITIIGARPQFIKASVVSKAIAENSAFQEIIVHTGQHFDKNMSDIFFNDLGIPQPHYQLDINGSTHGKMTGAMLVEIEAILLKEKPDAVMVYGDTNSTLAGALAASKLHIPLIHIEAGLRSFNMSMPEEINRILTDQISSILFCPTNTAITNLQQENFQNKSCSIFNVGDVMQDSALLFRTLAKKPFNESFLDQPYILATLHRAENTDDLERLRNIIKALNHTHQAIMPVVLPLHPRTKNIINQHNIELNVHTIEPVGYLEMIWLLENTSLVITDSGGVQKEAFFFTKPCVTTREQTEWVELIEKKANILAGADYAKIIDAVQYMLGKKISDPDQLYGGGQASLNIVKHLNTLL